MLEQLEELLTEPDSQKREYQYGNHCFLGKKNKTFLSFLAENKISLDVFKVKISGNVIIFRLYFYRKD